MILAFTPAELTLGILIFIGMACASVAAFLWDKARRTGPR
jgi:hypothetical protein